MKNGGATAVVILVIIFIINCTLLVVLVAVLIWVYGVHPPTQSVEVSRLQAMEAFLNEIKTFASNLVPEILKCCSL